MTEKTSNPRAETTCYAKLKGLIAAPHTPFKNNGDVNLPVIRQQAALLVASGVTGAYISGTTGEGISCTVSERKAMMANHGIDVGDVRLPLKSLTAAQKKDITTRLGRILSCTSKNCST